MCVYNREQNLDVVLNIVDEGTLPKVGLDHLARRL